MDQLTPGVENPEIVDLIQPDSSRDEVVLKIFESRPWASASEQLSQFDEKLNRYLIYTLDKHLVRDYPQYEGKTVRIEVECLEEPTDQRTLLFFEGVSTVCSQNGVGFRIVAKGTS